MKIENYDQKMDFVNKHQLQIENELREHANNFLQKNFDMRLGIPIKLNGRLTRALGRFRHQALGGSHSIEISKIACVEALLTEDNSVLYGVLEHECIHYALLEKGLPHEDDSSYFINSCNTLDVPLTGVVNVKQRQHHYKCAAGHSFLRARRVNLSTHQCGCGADLEYMGQVIE